MGTFRQALQREFELTEFSHWYSQLKKRCKVMDFLPHYQLFPKFPPKFTFFSLTPRPCIPISTFATKVSPKQQALTPNNDFNRF